MRRYDMGAACNEPLRIAVYAMKPYVRKIVSVVAILLVLAIMISTLSMHLFSARAQSQQVTPNASNPITVENALPGSTGWNISPGHMANTEIQAYANKSSLALGQKLTFFVSTKQAGTQYTIKVFRLGWYHGLGGRLVTTVSNQVGQAQGYFDLNTSVLTGCTRCHIDTTTGLVEANWLPSYSVTVPSSWTTGIYLAKFIDAHGLQTYTTFEVTGNATATYMVVTADTTNAAYNNWGGYSLYDYNSKVRASKVSFERPSTQQYGSSQALVFQADAIHWLERQGYNLAYISDVDLHTNPGILLKHKAYISIGHDEYWTKEMRDGVENARNHGVGLAFLEANAAYWQMRFEPDTAGVANRTIVCYKVSTYNNDLTRDPFYGVDNSRLTAEWRDPILNRPENALIGIMFSDYTHQQQGFPWKVDPAANSFLLANTGLVPGQQYGCGLVGYEWDKLFQNGATPAGLQVLATTATINDSGQADSSNTTAYISSAHSLVFATGGVYWTAALDTYRYQSDPNCVGQPTVIPEMQKLMSNVMAGLIVTH